MDTKTTSESKKDFSHLTAEEQKETLVLNTKIGLFRKSKNEQIEDIRTTATNLKQKITMRMIDATYGTSDEEKKRNRG